MKQKTDKFAVMLSVPASQLGVVLATLQREAVQVVSCDLVKRQSRPAEPPQQRVKPSAAIRRAIEEMTQGQRTLYKDVLRTARAAGARNPTGTAKGLLDRAVKDKILKRHGDSYVRL